MTEQQTTAPKPVKKLMTAADERMMLWKRGTRPTDFTARHLLQTAESDVWNWEYNQNLKEERQKLRAKKDFLGLKLVSASRGYGFLGRHVSKAKGSVVLLLQLALFECTSQYVIMSPKLSVAQLYEDHDRLEAALRLAGGRPLEEKPPEPASHGVNTVDDMDDEL